MKTLRKPRKCKIVIEYQTIEPSEFQSKGDWIIVFYDLLFGGLVRKSSDAVVGVTDEITKYELKRSGNPNIKYITIGNGFDVNSVNPRTPPPLNQEELSVLCLGLVDKWHGYDRIIMSIASYSGPLSVKLHIAGDGSEIPYQ